MFLPAGSVCHPPKLGVNSDRVGLNLQVLGMFLRRDDADPKPRSKKQQAQASPSEIGVSTDPTHTPPSQTFNTVQALAHFP